MQEVNGSLHFVRLPVHGEFGDQIEIGPFGPKVKDRYFHLTDWCGDIVVKTRAVSLPDFSVYVLRNLVRLMPVLWMGISPLPRPRNSSLIKFVSPLI